MRTFTKDGGIKRLHDTHSFANWLLANGWVEVQPQNLTEEKEENADTLDALKQRATELGIQFHHRAGEKKLKALIEAHNGNGS